MLKDIMTDIINHNTKELPTVQKKIFDCYNANECILLTMSKCFI